jgi:hypothetical protein
MYEKFLAKYGYNKGNSIDVSTLTEEILPELLATELEKFIAHPGKPGYRRSDVLARIKELRK